MGRRGAGRAPRVNWQNIPKENAQWENYYRTLNLPSSDESEFEKFKASCQQELPVTFRITGTSKDVIAVREIMEKKHIAKLKDQTWDGEPLEPPFPLPFYPERLAWQVNVGKQVIRRNAQFSDFQRFLVVETNAGNVSRQELVSMIPPLFLNVEPHHYVLDTCASPGSKTTQLLEFLHHNVPASHPPSGLVIANDSDYKRSHMLTHQIKRLNSPNIIVTNHDAQMYPRIWLGDSYLKFDRILCDVPCTGDATMRKNINVWKDWSVANGQGLHTLQLNIATRSVHLLKPDGARLVYSTCSLNPIENEAVVAQLLRQFPNLRLADVSKDIPELKRYNGISDWKVQEKVNKKWFTSHDESAESQKLPRSWFKPSEEESKRFNLDRCVRVYPQQQNSGGFFIAVLELDGTPVEVKDLEQKKRHGEEKESQAKRRATDSNEKSEEKTEEKPEATPEPTPEPSKETSTESATNETTAEPEAKKEKLPYNVPAFEEPFKFLSPEHPEVQTCIKFYGLKPEFNLDTLVVRNAEAEPSRTIYYVAPCLKPILENNEKKLKLIHAGIKLFNSQKNDGECKWRIQIEGLGMIAPYATKRIIRTSTMETLKNLCLETFIRFDEIKKVDPELHDQLVAVPEGCCIWHLNGAIYPLWRGKASTNLMAPKENTEELLLRLFDVDKKAVMKEKELKEAQEAKENNEAKEEVKDNSTTEDNSKTEEA